MHEARAGLLQKQLEAANARIAQLEDELTVERENTQAAYDSVKPPVTIISDSPTTTVDTDGGNVDGLALAAPQTETAARAQAEARATAYTLAAIVAGVIGIFWVTVKLIRKRRRHGTV